MTEIPILFLGGGKRVSLAERFIDEGKTSGLNVSIISYELTTEVPLAGTARIVIGKRWNDPDLLAHIRDVALDAGARIILPFVDQATLVAARLKTLIGEAFIPASDESVCELFLDKNRAESWFEENGFAIPRSNDTFPAIAKPIRGAASQGIQVFSSPAEMSAFFASRDRAMYTVQRFIDGEEFTVDCYVDRLGEILAIVPRRRLEVAGGEVLSSRTVRDNRLVDLSRDILRAGALRGPVNIQFIREKTSGEDFVIEVNPRFGGGAILSIEAGANFPRMVLNEALGIPNSPVMSWRENLLMMRAMREFFA